MQIYLTYVKIIEKNKKMKNDDTNMGLNGQCWIANITLVVFIDVFQITFQLKKSSKNDLPKLPLTLDLLPETTLDIKNPSTLLLKSLYYNTTK